MKSYLPSKKFILIMGGAVILIAIFSLIFFFYSKKESFINPNDKNGSALKIENQTVEELMKKDSDADGVADWEENLWGTDSNNPTTFNGVPDATYIANKKKDLNVAQVDNTNLTETDKFAREFFAAFSAMKASGQVDSTSINNFSNALGQKIINPNIVDQFSAKDVKVDNNNDTNNQKKYYAVLQKTFKGYQSIGLGDELSIISGEIGSPETSISPDQSKKLLDIAKAYKSFAQDVIQTPVPSDLVNYHLQIANSSNNIGLSVENMSKVKGDPIVGLSGISEYQKYSDDLVSSVQDLETALIK